MRQLRQISISVWVTARRKKSLLVHVQRGGMPDEQVIGDVTGAVEFLRAQRNSNGKVAVIGLCSGGRQAYLAACRIARIDSAVDCWGGNVVVDDPSKLPSTQPVAPIDLTEGIRCPLLGLFGNEDSNPSPTR
jgi:carboxymethylenebutenolidase